MRCATCFDTRKLDYDLGVPAWPLKPGDPGPTQILRDLPCPDCVSCVQCAHPNHDGVHSCRDGFQPTYDGVLYGRWLPKT